jgi:hypothetical protein
VDSTRASLLAHLLRRVAAVRLSRREQRVNRVAPRGRVAPQLALADILEARDAGRRA